MTPALGVLLSAGAPRRQTTVATAAAGGTQLLDVETDQRIVRRVRLTALGNGSGAATYAVAAFNQLSSTSDAILVLPFGEGVEFYVPGVAPLYVGGDAAGALVTCYVERWRTSEVVRT